MYRFVISLAGLLFLSSHLLSQPIQYHDDNIFILKADSSNTDRIKESKIKTADSTAILDNTIRNNDRLPKWHSMITNLPSDCYDWSKKYVNGNYALPIALISVSTALLIVTDDITYRESDKFYNRTQFNKNVSDFFTEFGDGRTQFILAGVFGLYGFVGSDNRALRTASQIVEAVLSDGFAVQVLKHITGRESPFVRSSPTGIWRFFPNQIQYHKHVPHYDAFPSGHISTSVATFVVIQENYPEQKWITPVSCALSGLICFGMVNKGIHWYSDYPLGIAMGYTFGKIVSGGIKASNDPEERGLSFTPSIDFDNINLKMTYNF
jgi:membrane-associated phospholipid phosphatase